jgi:hypothetical protein
VRSGSGATKIEGYAIDDRGGRVTELVDADDGRHETLAEKEDRNWTDLVQELRVTQTGAQILVGFLLTVPFQQRFATLDGYQRALYLVLVTLAVLATALIVTPVSLHRLLFGRHLKGRLVAVADDFARAGLVVLALAMVGVPALLFDVVVSRAAGFTALGAAVVLIVGCWWVTPHLVARRAHAGPRRTGLERPDGSVAAGPSAAGDPQRTSWTSTTEERT